MGWLGFHVEQLEQLEQVEQENGFYFLLELDESRDQGAQEKV